MTTTQNKIIYWIATVWLALGMVSTGLAQLIKAKEGPGGINSIAHLGYPIYFLTILGVWKILGALAVLVPKWPILKEWAYAGFFFVVSGAVYSHLAVGDNANEFFGLTLFLILIGVSWFLRPADRRSLLD